MRGADKGSGKFAVGDRASLSREISERDIELMAELTGDFNPVHLDADFARKTRFGGRIAHGVFTAGLISAVLGTKLPGPGSIYLSQAISFLHPVRPGDTITAEVEVSRWRSEKRIVHLATRCMNQTGVAVAEGEAVLVVERVSTGSGI